MGNFTNKTVFITGASKGIGEATARFFSQQGANVVLFARNQAALTSIEEDIKSTGGRALAVVGDVSDFKAFDAAIQSAITTFGGLDILVNNAGLIDPISLLADSDPEAWGKIVDVNVKGVYYGLRLALPHMLDSGGGTIINISSGAATSALAGWSHYCSTKAAVLSLTQCAHKEYFEQGINVIGLSPGTVATDMQVAIRDSGINPVSQLDWSAHIPASWVARAIGYLCSPDGKAYSGGDFSLKNNEGRAAVGLPTV